MSELFNQNSYFFSSNSDYKLFNELSLFTGPNSDENFESTQKNKLGKKRRKHTKENSDNIKRKVNVHYFIFLVDLINLIIEDILGDEYEPEKMRFLYFNYSFKKDVANPRLNNFKNLNAHKSNTIASFLIDDNNITHKGKKNHNLNAYNNIKNKNDKLINILDKPCFEFFSLFYEKKFEINLNVNGLNKIINLSKIKCFYEDVLKLKYMNDNNYISKMDKVINKYFIKKDVNLFVIRHNE